MSYFYFYCQLIDDDIQQGYLIDNQNNMLDLYNMKYELTDFNWTNKQSCFNSTSKI